jgi:hypothetical protein
MWARGSPATAIVVLGLLVSADASGQEELAEPRAVEHRSELPESSAQDAATEKMQAELRHQQEMLRRIQKGEPLKDTDLAGIDAPPELALPDEADPRVAPAAPRDRALPVAIFNESRVEVPAAEWGNRQLLRRVLDADRDGRPELVRYLAPETRQMVRQEEDRNYDGVTDAWSSYASGRLVARVLDSNDDGNPDLWERYRDGRMISREIDRDDDGVRDAFYVYDGSSLVEERHDANNDGRVDLRIAYSDRRRSRAEEDQDKDGRMDTWRSYSVVGDVELVSRIERDRKGRGFADTFEIFEAVKGRAVLSRREEDLNGDGEVDVTSFYRDGKLIRREILDPDLVPL